MLLLKLKKNIAQILSKQMTSRKSFHFLWVTWSFNEVVFQLLISTFFHETFLANSRKSFQQKVVANSKNINENATETEAWFCNNHSKESLKKPFTQSRDYLSNKTKKSSAIELQLFEAKQQKQTFLLLTSFLETSRKQYVMTHLDCFC